MASLVFIYCATRKKTWNLTGKLNRAGIRRTYRMNGHVRSPRYSALLQLMSSSSSSHQCLWHGNWNKSNPRQVIHYAMPKFGIWSLAEMGKISLYLVLFRPRHYDQCLPWLNRVGTRLDARKLNEMIDYCALSMFALGVMLRYFGIPHESNWQSCAIAQRRTG